MNESDKQKDDFPKGMFLLVGILLVVFVIITLKSLGEGTYYFLTDGGWVWALVVGIPILLILLFGKSSKD